MIFLIFGIVETILAVIILILCMQYPILLISLIAVIINCILWFTLYAMYRRIKDLEDSMPGLVKSISECRLALKLGGFKNDFSKPKTVNYLKTETESATKTVDCPACYHNISQNDTKCPYCGYKLK